MEGFTAIKRSVDRTKSYDAACQTHASGVTSFADDFESRITSISRGGMTTNSYTYNGLDTRVGVVDSLGSRSIRRNGVGVTAPVLGDGLARYVTSGEVRGGVKTTFHAGLKNADLQTNVSAVASASRTYDAFGNVVGATGTWRSPFGHAGPFGYQSDADTGFQLLGHRYYDPSTGRFLTRDPAKDGRNWYTYCSNSPVTFADPTGLVQVQIFGDLYEFNADSVTEGLKTAGYAFGHSISMGLWGGEHADRPGFQQSTIAWDVATGALGGAAGYAKAAGRAGAGAAGKAGSGAAGGAAGGSVGSLATATADDLIGSGVYGLYENGKLRYIGRTIDFLRREAEHGTDELFGKFEFRVIERSDDLENLRFLEQYHMDMNGGIDELLDKINAVGKRGKHWNPYQDFLASRWQ